MTDRSVLAFPDIARLRRRFQQPNRRAVGRASISDPLFLHRKVGEELVERLRWLRCPPGRVLDIAVGGGGVSSALAQQFPSANVVQSDLASFSSNAGGARSVGHERVAACPDQLPFANASQDHVVANLVLPWFEPSQIFQSIHRVLVPGGGFSFSTLGPDTLAELREAFGQADEYPHVHDFIDMHNLGDTLGVSGFSEPVLDVQRLVLTYSTLGEVARDLRALQFTNLHPGRSKGLLGRRAHQRLIKAYETNRRGDGRLPVTVEIVYGVAFTGTPSARGGTLESEIAVTW
ncbi:MAG: methyltransferase domain-containing protein [Arenicellales bacterium]|nr:methyltransferase domain-containing protein [Arenicellales bacterium]